MDTVTYPDSNLIKAIHEHLIPVKIPSEDEKLLTSFRIKWTPTLIILDQEGNEHHRILGFMDSDELIPSLLLGIAKCCFDADQLENAKNHLDLIIERHADSTVAPEGLFLKGVCGFKQSHEPSILKKTYEQLYESYPESTWCKRAFPYRLL
jgi:hypothetical protein